MISAGSAHTCAIHDDGVLKCWGCNLSGQVGNGTSGSNTITDCGGSDPAVRASHVKTPTQVSTLSSEVKCYLGWQ